MKKHYLILIAGLFIFVSCQKGEMTEDGLQQEVLPEEYFIAEVNGKTYVVKDTARIGGTVYPSYDTGVINFDFSGYIVEESREVDFLKGFSFKVCFYDGTGTYYTGTTQTVSWAIYWSDFDVWENHYSSGNEPGIVVVTNATDKFVEGIFEFDAFNNYLETMVNVTGEFGVKLETFEEYNL